MTDAVIDDREIHIPGFSPVCGLCRHRILKPRRTCAAFPDGIPMRIWQGQHDHTRPYRGDRGLRFSPQRPEDLDTLEAIARGERIPDGLSVAQFTERRQRVAS